MQQDTTLGLLNSVKSEPQSSNTWVSATGVVFKLRKVSAFALKDATDKIKNPKPPKWHNEIKGIDEENPADPAYIEELAITDYRRGMLAINVIIGLGSQVGSYNGFQDEVQSTDWSDRLTFIGELDIPESGPARYMAWIKYSGVVSESEMADLAVAIQRVSGFIQEEDVQQASFPLDEKRNTTGPDNTLT